MDGPAPLAKLLTQRERRKKFRDSKGMKNKKKKSLANASPSAASGDLPNSEGEAEETVMTGKLRL